METKEAINQFIISCQSRNLSPHTTSSYYRRLSYFFRDCPDIPLAPALIEGCQSRLTAKSSITRHGYYRAAKRFYNWLCKRYELGNPYDKLDAPRKGRAYPKILEAEQRDLFLKALAPSRDLLLGELLLDTGLRISEALSLRRQNILAAELIVFGKTGQRRVPVSPEIRNKLLQIGGSDYIFLNENNGSPLGYSGARKFLRKALIAAGIETGVHCLRHTFGSACIAAGLDQFSVMRMLGHTSTSTTNIYIHMNNTQLIQKHNQFSPLREYFHENR